MITVQELINFLEPFPSDALIYAYEGEITAIVVIDANYKHQLGYTEAGIIA